MMPQENKQQVSMHRNVLETASTAMLQANSYATLIVLLYKTVRKLYKMIAV